MWVILKWSPCISKLTSLGDKMNMGDRSMTYGGHIGSSPDTHTVCMLFMGHGVAQYVDKMEGEGKGMIKPKAKGNKMPVFWMTQESAVYKVRLILYLMSVVSNSQLEVQSIYVLGSPIL